MNQTRLSIARACCAVVLLIGFGLPALANVPLAGREADRQAKFAVPAAGEALLYVYRRQESGPPAVAVSLNGRDAVRLAPRTFMLWRLKPGRVELGAEGTASTVTFRAEGGRVYYVELSRSPAGLATLRPVSFPVGRTQIQQAQLVARSPAAAPPAPRDVAPSVRQPGNLALALKLGSFKLAEESQSILSATRTFDTSASSVFALEGEWFMRPDTSFGLEVVSYSSDYSTPSNPTGAGAADTTAVLFNAKRYFVPGSVWQPNLGLGVGAATVDFSATGAGGITGSTGGLALQVVAGVQWRRDRLALRAEYKYLNVDTEDDSNQKVDMSGSGFFLGAGFYF